MANYTMSPHKSAGSLEVSQINLNDHHFTFDSQMKSKSFLGSSFRIKTDKDETNSQSDCREQLRKEMKMKIQSLTKGFQIKIAREKETFDLKEMKYQEEINYLKNKIKELSQPQRMKPIDNSTAYCSLCSNGEVITHMKNMLDQIETDHSQCLSQKSSLNGKILQLEQKIDVLNEECSFSEQKYKKLKDEHRRLKNDIDVIEREKREKERLFRQQERSVQIKQFQLEEEIKKQKDLQQKLNQSMNKMSYENKKLEENYLLMERNSTVNQKENSFFKQRDLEHVPSDHRLQNLRKISAQINKCSLIGEKSLSKKGKDSYADYVNMKRSSVGPNLKNIEINSFDTFRPKKVEDQYTRTGNRFSYMY